MKFPWTKRAKTVVEVTDVWEKAGQRSGATAVVVLIHGLGSDARSSWSPLLKLCLADSALDDFAFIEYQYPTRATGLRFWESLPGLDVLAKGLATEIALRTCNYNRILIIAHSMGGLIVRKLIVDQIRECGKTTVSAALLLATPNSGAGIAKIGSMLFPRHTQNKLLAPFSDSIVSLNDAWVELKADDHSQVRLVAGGLDQIVEQSSVRGIAGRKLDGMLVGLDHSTIIRPKTHGDSSYLLVKSFLLDNISRADSVAIMSDGDPLFEAYRIRHEPYYVIRKEDAALSTALDSSHVWVSGPSGVGKTAAVTRSILLRGWETLHVYLGSYAGADTTALLHAVRSEVFDRRGELDDTSGATVAETISRLATALAQTPTVHTHVALVIEEIPISCPHEYAVFCGYLQMLFEALESRGADNVRVAITSIIDPHVFDLSKMGKFRSKVTFTLWQKWEADDVHRLAALLNDALSLNRTDEELEAICASADGSPRFVKAIFRKWHNGTCGTRSLTELIEQTRGEM